MSLIQAEDFEPEEYYWYLECQGVLCVLKCESNGDGIIFRYIGSNGWDHLADLLHCGRFLCKINPPKLSDFIIST